MLELLKQAHISSFWCLNITQSTTQNTVILWPGWFMPQMTLRGKQTNNSCSELEMQGKWGWEKEEVTQVFKHRLICDSLPWMSWLLGFKYYRTDSIGFLRKSRRSSLGGVLVCVWDEPFICFFFLMHLNNLTSEELIRQVWEQIADAKKLTLEFFTILKKFPTGLDGWAEVTTMKLTQKSRIYTWTPSKYRFSIFPETAIFDNCCLYTWREYTSSSSEPAARRRKTTTCRFCPKRNDLSCACKSCAGFQFGSKITTLFALTRFKPRPPARVDIRNTYKKNMLESHQCVTTLVSISNFKN